MASAGRGGAVPASGRPAKSSAFRGVSFHNGARKWQAWICVRRTNHFLGLYDDEAAAAQAYDKAALRLRGLQAKTNFNVSTYDLASLPDFGDDEDGANDSGEVGGGGAAVAAEAAPAKAVTYKSASWTARGVAPPSHSPAGAGAASSNKGTFAVAAAAGGSGSSSSGSGGGGSGGGLRIRATGGGEHGRLEALAALVATPLTAAQLQLPSVHDPHHHDALPSMESEDTECGGECLPLVGKHNADTATAAAVDTGSSSDSAVVGDYVAAAASAPRARPASAAGGAGLQHGFRLDAAPPPASDAARHHITSGGTGVPASLGSATAHAATPTHALHGSLAVAAPPLAAAAAAAPMTAAAGTSTGMHQQYAHASYQPTGAPIVLLGASSASRTGDNVAMLALAAGASELRRLPSPLAANAASSSSSSSRGASSGSSSASRSSSLPSPAADSRLLRAAASGVAAPQTTRCHDPLLELVTPVAAAALRSRAVSPAALVDYWTHYWRHYTATVPHLPVSAVVAHCWRRVDELLLPGLPVGTVVYGHATPASAAGVAAAARDDASTSADMSTAHSSRGDDARAGSSAAVSSMGAAGTFAPADFPPQFGPPPPEAFTAALLAVPAVVARIGGSVVVSPGLLAKHAVVAATVPALLPGPLASVLSLQSRLAVSPSATTSTSNDSPAATAAPASAAVPGQLPTSSSSSSAASLDPSLPSVSGSKRARPLAPPAPRVDADAEEALVAGPPPLQRPCVASAASS